MPSTQEHDFYAVRLVITVVIVTIVWVSVTMITSKEMPSSHLIDFYKKMRIPGPGWNKIRLLASMKPEKGELKYNFLGWLFCVLFIYSSTIGIGQLLFQRFISALICVVISFVCGYILFKILRKTGAFSPEKS